MPIDWNPVRVLRVFIAVAVVAVSVTAAHAQTNGAPVSNTSCADVKPPIPSSQDTFSNVPIYLVQPGAPQHQSVCEATEALAEGMVDIALDDVWLSRRPILVC
jgi:hypothetical protein